MLHIYTPNLIIEISFNRVSSSRQPLIRLNPHPMPNACDFHFVLFNIVSISSSQTLIEFRKFAKLKLNPIVLAVAGQLAVRQSHHTFAKVVGESTPKDFYTNKSPRVSISAVELETCRQKPQNNKREIPITIAQTRAIYRECAGA